MSKVTFHFQLLFSHPFRLSFSRFKFIRFPRSHGIRTYRSISTTVDPNAWFYVYVCRGSITLHYTSTIDGRGLHQRGFIGSLATLRSMSHTHTHIDLTRWTPLPFFNGATAVFTVRLSIETAWAGPSAVKSRIFSSLFEGELPFD